MNGRCPASTRVPTEFRRGQTLSQQDLIVRLNDLGYADRPAVTQPGEFTGFRNVLTLIPRGGELAGKTIKITFPAGRVTRQNPNPAGGRGIQSLEVVGQGRTERRSARSAASDLADGLGHAREAASRAAGHDP